MVDKIEKIDNTDTYKFNDWKNAPTLHELKADLETARSDHEKYVARLKQYRIDFNGGPMPTTLPNKSTARSNLIRKHSEWRYPIWEDPFLSSEKIFDVSPRSFEDEDSAKQNSDLINYQWNILVDKVGIITKMARNYEDEGTAIIKTGWNAEYEEKVVDVEKTVYASPEDSVAMIQKAVEEGAMTQEQAMQFMESGQAIPTGTEIVQEMQEVLVRNHPTYEVKNNESIIVDPTCGDDLSQANFIIDEFETSIAELKKDEYKGPKLRKKKTVEYPDGGDEAYEESDEVYGEKEETEAYEDEEESGFYFNLHLLSNAENEESQYKRIHGESKIENNFKFNDGARKKLTAYEYWGFWDIHGDNTLVPIIATWIGTTLIRMEENPFPHKKLPFDAAANLPLKNNWRGEPSGILIVDNQNQIGRMTRAMNDMVSQKAIGQMFIDDDLFASRTEKDNYENGRTVMIRPGKDARSGIHREKLDPVDATAVNTIQFNEAQAESMTGVRPFGASSAKLSGGATGVRNANDATAKRELSSLRRLSGSLMLGVGRKTIIMNQAFMSEEEVIRITNKEYVTIKREDIQGEFDLIINVSTPEKDEAKAQDLGFIMQTNAANMDPKLAQKVLGKIVRLKKEPGLANDIETHIAEPTQQELEAHASQMRINEMQEKLLEMQLLEIGKRIENYDSNILEKTSRVAENSSQKTKEDAHARLYDAQADNLNSQTDMIDQDFVRKEEGSGEMSDAEKIAEARFDKIAERENVNIDAEDNHQRALELERFKQNNNKGIE